MKESAEQKQRHQAMAAKETVAIAPTSRTQVKRLPKRASYERETINRLLDGALLCHVGFAVEGQPYVIPTLHVRIGGRLYIHGSAASRMLGEAAAGASLCITVTNLDGLVLARSAFNHSVNYRSVVILGQATIVTEAREKLAVLEELVEKVAKGRWEHVRQPNAKELNATSVLWIPILETSAKIRTGPPNDDEEDCAQPIWAGVIPLSTGTLAPVVDPRVDRAVPIPEHVANYRLPADRGGA